MNMLDELASLLPLAIFVSIIIAYFIKWRIFCQKPVVYTKAGGIAEQITSRVPLLKERYTPSFFLLNCHAAMIFVAKCFERLPIRYELKAIRAADGGDILLEFPVRNAESTRDTMIVFVPGVTGITTDKYVVHFVELALRQGHKVVFINHRGLDSKKEVRLRTPRAFCSATTDDIHTTMDYLREQFPSTKFIGVSASMGSLIMTKYMGETGDKCPFVTACMLSNVWCLDAFDSAMKVFPSNKIYFPHLYNAFQRFFKHNSHLFPERGDMIDLQKLRRASSTNEIAEAVVLPMFGFKTIQEYNTAAASVNHLHKIRRPVLYLNALDDPMTSPDVVPVHAVQDNPHVAIATTLAGSHGAYPIGWWPTAESYADRVFIQYIDTALGVVA